MSGPIIQYGQSTGGAPGYILNFTFPNPVTLGNKIIILGGHSYAGCPVSVSSSVYGNNHDELGNIYTARGGQPSFDLGIIEVFDAPITTAGTCSINLNARCGNARNRYFFAEVSGAIAFDAITSVQGKGTTGLVTSSLVTTTGAHDLLFGMFFGPGSGQGSPWTTGSGFTMITSPNDNSTLDCLEYKYTSGAGNYSASANINTSGAPSWGFGIAYTANLVTGSVTTPPTSDFTTSVNLKTITLTDASVAGSNPISGYDTDWGDGSAHGSTKNDVHTYSDGVGSHVITRTVTDGTTPSSNTETVITKTRNIYTIVTQPGGGISTITADIPDGLGTFEQEQAQVSATGVSARFSVGNIIPTVVTDIIIASPSFILASPGAYPIQLTVTDNGTDVTSDSATNYTSGNLTLISIDSPTLTGVSSPSTITQGTGPTTFTWPCTNPNSAQTLGGLSSGIIAGAATVVDSTHIAFNLTASGSATVGTASVYLVDSVHGNSNTEILIVNSSVTTPPLSGSLRRYVASSGTNTTTNGATITTWTDTIASKVMSATGTFITYVTSGLNGKPTIHNSSNGTASWLVEAVYDASLNTSAMSVVVIFKSSGTPGTSVNFVAIANNSDGSGWSLGEDTGGHIGANASGPDLYDFPGPTLGTTGHTVLMTANSSGASASLDSTVWKTNSGTFQPGTGIVSGSKLSVFNSTFGNSWVGDIAEIIIYDHVLGSTERTAITSYVSTIYGV